MPELPIGYVLRGYRKHRGLTQQEVAERIGVDSGNYISRLEGSHRLMSLPMLIRISDALEVEAWKVLRRAQRMVAAASGTDEVQR